MAADVTLMMTSLASWIAGSSTCVLDRRIVYVLDPDVEGAMECDSAHGAFLLLVLASAVEDTRRR